MNVTQYDDKFELVAATGHVHIQLVELGKMKSQMYLIISLITHVMRTFELVVSRYLHSLGKIVSFIRI